MDGATFEPVTLSDLRVSDIGRRVVVLAVTGSVAGVLDDVVFRREREGNVITAPLTGEVSVCFAVQADENTLPTFWNAVPLTGTILIDRTSTPPKPERPDTLPEG